ncbi:hypothetical protein [Sphingobacterium endophyticum]|nr:hypothetical protein [Sphingobacterium endophyticum]
MEKITLDIDAEGWRPSQGFLDKNGNPVEERIGCLKILGLQTP